MAAASASPSSWIAPSLPECEDDAPPPGWALLDMRCYIADLPNASTATGLTSCDLLIQVTFRAARPPLLSHLCVHCPGLDFRKAPTIFAADTDLVLLRVPLDPFSPYKVWYWDYFVYRFSPTPSLDRLPYPYTFQFNEKVIAVLSRGGGGFVVAALTDALADTQTEYDLHLYNSDAAAKGWTSKHVSVQEPVRETVAPITDELRDNGMPYHETSKTIVVGGERGTIGWVDLWRGILLCDVLDDDPVLRDLPLPLPARANWGLLQEQHPPILVRDVTVSHRRDSIKYIEMELYSLITQAKEATTTTNPDFYLEWVRYKRKNPVLLRDGWNVTAWSTPIPVESSPPAPASLEDWHRECDVHVGDLAVHVADDLRQSELLSKMTGRDDAKEALCTLTMAYPTISMDDDGAIYFFSGARKIDELQAVVAVDMRNKTLRGVAELDIQKNFRYMRAYCSIDISTYPPNKTAGTGEALKPTEAQVKKLASRKRGGKKHKKASIKL